VLARLRLAAMTVAVGIAVISCGEDDRPAPPAPSPTSPAASLPVVLEYDTRIIVAAATGDYREERIEPGRAFPQPGESPDGTRRLLVRDGRVVIEGAGESVEIAGVVADGENVNAIWSPDGSGVAFDASFSGTSTALYVVNADGAGLADVGSGLGPGDAFPLAWSADSRRVAFGTVGAAPDFVSTLFVAQADGGGRRELGAFVQPQGDAGWDPPRFSPDSSKIVAFYGQQGIAGLRIFDTSAGTPPVDVPVAAPIKFSWSPDGSRLAYDAFDAATQRHTVRVADAVSGASAELAEGHSPRWSPDGSHIAFKRTMPVSGQVQVFLRDMEAGNDAAIGPPGNYTFSDLRWSDDGSELNFTKPAFSAAQLYRVDLRAGTAERLGATMGALGDPPQDVSVAPDEGRVAFFRNGEWSLMDLASGDSTLITTTGFGAGDVHCTDAGPRIAQGGPRAFIAEPDGTARELPYQMVHRTRFSPDGERVALLIMQRLVVVDADGGRPAEVYEGDVQSDLVQDVDWAPDGKRLTFTVSHSDAVTGVSSLRALVAEADGSAPARQVGPENSSLPYWSPDGAMLAQARAGASGYAVWVTDNDGGAARQVAELRGSCCEALYWSPDGSHLAFADQVSAVMVAAVESGEVATAVVTGGGCGVRIAGWSHDGASLFVYTACYFGIYGRPPPPPRRGGLNY
jgi:Tol biopolymer transport system component